MEILLKGFFTVSNFMHFLGYAVTVTSCKRVWVSRSVIHTGGLCTAHYQKEWLEDLLRVLFRFFFVDRFRGLVLNSRQLNVGSFIFFFILNDTPSMISPKAMTTELGLLLWGICFDSILEFVIVSSTAVKNNFSFTHNSLVSCLSIVGKICALRTVPFKFPDYTTKFYLKRMVISCY